MIKFSVLVHCFISGKLNVGTCVMLISIMIATFVRKNKTYLLVLFDMVAKNLPVPVGTSWSNDVRNNVVPMLSTLI